MRALALLVLLSACKTMYEPTRAGAEPFDSANAECDYRASVGSQGNSDVFATAAIYQRLYRGCMRARGWAPQ